MGNAEEVNIVREKGTSLHCTEQSNFLQTKDEQEKITSKVNKRPSARKGKKNNQLSDDKKENVRNVKCKKVNTGRIAKQKVSTRRSYKTSSKPDANKILKQDDKKPLNNYTKVELYKINSEGCYKCNLPPFTSVKSETMMYDTKFTCPINVTKQQELNQYGLENNMNMLQHLDYNNLRYTNQQAMSAASIIAPKIKENFVLNNSISNMQNETGQSSYINDKHYVSVDYNWNTHENPYFNSVVNSTNPYKLLPENKSCYPYSIYGPNWVWNNVYTQNFPTTNAMFQHATSNVAPNYILPANASNNFLSPAATPFNPFYYYQPLLTNDFRKLYHTSLINNNGYELTVKKENMMPQFNNWHHSNSLTIPNNNLNSNLNISTTPMWYNAVQTSNFLDANTSAISHADKVQFKCEQNAYLTNHDNTDMTNIMKVNLYKNQWREKDNFAPYQLKPAFQNTLPPITILATTPIDTYALESYKESYNGLTSTLTHQNSTAINDNMLFNIADPTSEMIADLPFETTAVDVSEELNTYCLCKDKKLISEMFESIL